MANPTATLHTNHGEITVELFEERAPNTVGNFIGLATGSKEWTDPETGDTVENQPLYEDVIFHRIIEGFMIQGGDPTGTGRGGPGYQFDDEFHDELTHDSAGTLSMANAGQTLTARSSLLRSVQPHISTANTRCSVRSSRAWTLSKKSVRFEPMAKTNRTTTSSLSRSTSSGPNDPVRAVGVFLVVRRPSVSDQLTVTNETD